MDVGQKLKETRRAVDLTQEAVAEEIGVSRQTLSNWENGRSYPDIRSVISLSDLYSLSLDELLKGDAKMTEHLEKSTDVVGSRQKLTRLILLISYLVIWSVSVLTFWLGTEPDEAMGYALLVFYLVLPLSTLIVSLFIGKDDAWGNTKWLMPLFFGFMFVLTAYITFSLANMISFDTLNFPDLALFFPGAVVSAIGMGIGTLMRRPWRKPSENPR